MKKFSRHIAITPIVVLSGFLVAVFTTSANGQTTFDWTGSDPTGNFWDLPDNWNPSGPPTAADTARFDLLDNYEVLWDDITGDTATDSMEILRGFVNFRTSPLATERRTHTSDSLNISTIGSDSFATLTLNGIDLNLGSTSLNAGSQHDVTMQLEDSLSILGDVSLAGFDDSGSAGGFTDGFSKIDVFAGSAVQSGSVDIGLNSAVSVEGNWSQQSGSLTISGFVEQFGTANLSVTGGGSYQVLNGSVSVSDLGSIVVGEPGGAATSTLTASGQIQVDAAGFVLVDESGMVSSGDEVIISNGGQVAVAGQFDSELMTVGNDVAGTLTIGAGGVVNTTGEFSSVIGFNEDSDGFASVSDDGSQWNNSSGLTVGGFGDGNLLVENGGEVGSLFGQLAATANSTGWVEITDSGSQWNIAEDLFVGVGGDATLRILNDGILSVGGTTTIGANANVTVDGGRFEFGQTTLSEFAVINAVDGSLAGNLNHQGFTDVSTLTALQNPNVDLTDVTLANSGTLFGNGSLGTSLINQAGGEVQSVAGDLIRIAGSGQNFGEINNFGGMVRFDGQLTNESSGFIGGRGVFIANDGIQNGGVMAFTGTTDLLGDIEMAAGSLLVTSGGATTTIFDDLIHNGDEIRTSAGSNTVILGEATGAGDFTGTGTVFFEGDLRPGNSPDTINFAGNLVLGTNANSFFELAGEAIDEFDRLLIDGNFSIGGDLFVDLIDGFELENNMSFLIAGADQSFGQFNGLDEGDLVGNFNGTELFISYQAGDGNDVSLYTAVPEPGSLLVCGLLTGMVLVRRRRKC